MNKTKYNKIKEDLLDLNFDTDLEDHCQVMNDYLCLSQGLEVMEETKEETRYYEFSKKGRLYVAVHHFDGKIKLHYTGFDYDVKIDEKMTIVCKNRAL